MKNQNLSLSLSLSLSTLYYQIPLPRRNVFVISNQLTHQLSLFIYIPISQCIYIYKLKISLSLSLFLYSIHYPKIQRECSIYYQLLKETEKKPKVSDTYM